MKRMFLLAWLGLGAPAWAQVSPEERAKVLYQNGSTLYDEGQYEAAILAFNEGYEISKRPAFLYNIANCYERLGDLEKAIHYLNQYRAFATPEERERLERRIRAIEARQAELAAATPPPDTTTTTTTTTTTGTPPPDPTLPPVVGGDGPESGSRGGQMGTMLLGVGGGLVVLGGGTAALTYSRSQTWIAENDQETYDRWRPVNLVGLTAAGVGAGLAVVGGVGLVAGRMDLQPTPGGGTLHLHWSF